MTNNPEDLRARLNDIAGTVEKNDRRGRVAKMLGTAALSLVVGAGGYFGIQALSNNAPDEAALPASSAPDYPEDRFANENLEPPRVPDPVVIERTLTKSVVDTVSTDRLNALELELERLRTLAARGSDETEAERLLRLKVEGELSDLRASIVTLRTSAAEDLRRIEEALRKAEGERNDAILQAKRDEIAAEQKRREAVLDAETLAQKHLTTMLEEANNAANKRFNDAQAAAVKTEREREAYYQELIARLEEQAKIDPLEQERLRLEREKLARRERLQKEAIARQMARINSGLIALSNSGNEEAGATSAERTLTDNEAFVSRAVESVAVSRAERIARPEATVAQGTLIQAALETAIDSSLPGAIRSIVTEDVHSFDGSAILIPRGSKMFGEYKSDLELGQKRILVVWTRILTPNGLSINIASYGGDRLGRSGTTGFVDTKFATRFGGAAAISLIGAIPGLLSNSQDNATTADTLENVGDDLQSASDSVIGEYLSVPPSIYVKQGSVVTVIIDRDLEIF